jgi:hypothetical protein
MDSTRFSQLFAFRIADTNLLLTELIMRATDKKQRESRPLFLARLLTLRTDMRLIAYAPY